MFPRNSSGSLELVVISKITVFEHLNNHLARVPVTPNQQGTHEIKEEVFSSVGAQDMDTNGYQYLQIWTMLNSTGKMINWM